MRPMRKIPATCLVAALAISFGQLACAKGSAEADKFAREAFQASKDKDWSKAIEMFRKAYDLNHKYAENLAVAYERRGFAAASEQKFQDAIADFSEAIKVNPKDPRAYEQRAAMEMKVQDYDKALADYTEAIKLNPKEIRGYLYRGYIYEIKRDNKKAMADTNQALKIDSDNREALDRKARLQIAIKPEVPISPPPQG